VSKTTTLRINFIRRNARRGGPAYSDIINASFEELALDLSAIASQWNTTIVPLLITLPSGTTDDGLDQVDAFVEGLTGKTIYVDTDATVSIDTAFFNATQQRPNSIKDQFDALYAYINDADDVIRSWAASLTGALTPDQKNSIGIHIFNPALTSSAFSLDGLTQTLEQNVHQLACDLYDTAHADLHADGTPLLGYSIRDHLDALLAIHNGLFDSDLSLNHVGQINATDIVGILPQSGVDNTTIQDDTYAGTPVNLEDDLNQIRTQIKDVNGTASWLSEVLDFNNNPISLQQLLTAYAGSSTQDADNPWGLHYSDLDGTWQDVTDLLTTLTNVRTFTGMTDFDDGGPSFSSMHFITGSLEHAAGDLDAALYSHEQNTSNPHTTTLTQVATAGGEAPASQISLLDTEDLYNAATAEQAFAELRPLVNTLQVDVITNSGLLHNEIVTDSGLLHDSIQGHIDNTSNPHVVTANQIGADNLIEEVNAYHTTAFTEDVLPIDIIYSEDLDLHIQGTGGDLPSSGQHWGQDIDCNGIYLGNPSGLSNFVLNPILTYVFTDSNFRRLDIPFSGFLDDMVVHIEHNKGFLPLAQIVEQTGEDTYEVITTGMLVTHSGFLSTDVTNNTGLTIDSGLILLQW
jgi:hypothetical protein